MATVKMVRSSDGAEAVVEAEEVEMWRGYGFAPESEAAPAAQPKRRKGK